MKNASIWSIACLLSATVFAQSDQKTDAQRAKLAGPVKVVKTEKPIKSAESKGIDGKFPVFLNDTTTVYNRAGNIEEEIHSGEGGEVKLKRVFNYDSAGKLFSVLDYDTHGAVLGRFVYTYGPVKNEVVESYYNPQGEYLSKKVSVYNDKGERIRYSYYETKGILVNEISTKPSADGVGTETTWLKLNGETWFRTVTVVRDNGKTIETITYEPDGTLTSKSIERRNDEGTEIRITEYDAKYAIKSITLITRMLDSYGNWVVDKKFLVDPKGGSAKLIQTTNRNITYY